MIDCVVGLSDVNKGHQRFTVDLVCMLQTFKHVTNITECYYLACHFFNCEVLRLCLDGKSIIYLHNILAINILHQNDCYAFSVNCILDLGIENFQSKNPENENYHQDLIPYSLVSQINNSHTNKFNLRRNLMLSTQSKIFTS